MQYSSSSNNNSSSSSSSSSSSNKINNYTMNNTLKKNYTINGEYYLYP